MFQDYLAHNEGVLNWVTSMGQDGEVSYFIDDNMRHKGFIKRTFNRLDDIIPVVDFTRIETKDSADILLSEVDTMPEGFSNATGLAEYKYSEDDRKTVELTFRFSGIPDYGKNRINRNARKYTILHEIGHAMGLEHPFSYRDGDGADGILGSQSVMSYDRYDFISEGKVKRFRPDDYDTISGIWNDTSRFSDAIEKSEKEELKEPPICFTCGNRH